jgi:hypothetical protein
MQAGHRAESGTDSRVSTLSHHAEGNFALTANNGRCNPVDGPAEARESPVHNHEIFVGHDRSRFLLQDALDWIEQALAAGRVMRAALNAVR